MSDHSSSALWQHPLRAVESPGASSPPPQPATSNLILFVPVYQDWSGEASLDLPPLPPTFKNISWTISMCPHPGQLLLLTNYRLCNPVTHQAFGSCGNRQGFQGGQRLGQGQTTAEQVFTNTRASGHKMVFNVQGFSKLLWLTGKKMKTRFSKFTLSIKFKKGLIRSFYVLIVTSVLHDNQWLHAYFFPREILNKGLQQPSKLLITPPSWWPEEWRWRCACG